MLGKIIFLLLITLVSTKSFTNEYKMFIKDRFDGKKPLVIKQNKNRKKVIFNSSVYVNSRSLNLIKSNIDEFIGKDIEEKLITKKHKEKSIDKTGIWTKADYGFQVKYDLLKREKTQKPTGYKYRLALTSEELTNFIQPIFIHRKKLKPSFYASFVVDRFNNLELREENFKKLANFHIKFNEKGNPTEKSAGYEIEFNIHVIFDKHYDMKNSLSKQMKTTLDNFFIDEPLPNLYNKHYLKNYFSAFFPEHVEAYDYLNENTYEIMRDISAKYFGYRKRDFALCISRETFNNLTLFSEYDEFYTEENFESYFNNKDQYDMHEDPLNILYKYNIRNKKHYLN